MESEHRRMNLEKSKQRGSWEDSRACLSPSTGAGEQRIGAASARAESRFGTGRLCNDPESPKLLLRSTALWCPFNDAGVQDRTCSGTIASQLFQCRRVLALSQSRTANYRSSKVTPMSTSQL
jgi:hypothetical protein